ncbi:Dynamin-related protein DNM1 [Fusarium oxysporum f. sp. albedinis]|nr:Dynamin-related protein DNM1 [Fusarium oxysporum f. sp. albedinis]
MSPGRQESSPPETLRSMILTTTSRFEIFCDNDGGLRAGARGQGEGRRMGKYPAHDRAQKKRFEGGESIACSNSR